MLVTTGLAQRSMVVMERKAILHEGPFEHDSVQEPERRLYCERYSKCLVETLKRKWTSWHCEGCGCFVECSPQQKRDDMFGLLRLLVEVNTPSRHRRREDDE